MIKENENFKLVNTSHPKIGANIALFWSHSELMPYINQIIHDSRDGSRHGFTAEISSALVDLMIEHDKIYPQHGLKSDDNIWTDLF